MAFEFECTIGTFQRALDTQGKMTTREVIKKYRDRAAELRSLAASVKDTANRALLLEVAEDYERLVKSFERAGVTRATAA